MKNLVKYIVVGALMLACIVYLFSRCSIFSPDSAKSDNSKGSEKVTASGNPSDAELQKIIDEMTLEEKLYQMFFVSPEQLTGVGEVIQAGETTKKAIAERPVGGIVYFSQNLQTPEQTKEMLEKTQEFSKIPMFFAIDEEGGTVSRLADNPAMNMEKIESMSEIGKSGDTERAYEVGVIIGEKLYELGFNVDFAPVADVIPNGENNVIGSRSFGSDTELVSEMVSNVVLGLDKNGISATLKHFPGQGATTGDTHYDYVASERSEDQIRETELKPFISGIESGADFVMIGHMTVKSLDSKNPATFSKAIVTDLLREELGFEGLIITDAMNMGAILNTYTSGDAAVSAVKAGVDIILMPNDLEKAYEALYDAVKDGEIEESRIDESVMRILRLKAEKGLI